MKIKKNTRQRSEQMQQVSAGLRDVLGITQWRKEHPKATWAEIEAVIDERINQLRAQLIQDVVQMGETEAWKQKPEEERPRCAILSQGALRARRTDALPANQRRGSSQAHPHVWDLPP